MEVSIIQSVIHWEEPEKNFQHFENLVNNFIAKTDLIVLPEMFTTGFSMNCKKLADKHPGKTLEWMQKLAHKNSTAVTGSCIVSDHHSFYNRLYFVYPDGNYVFYDKKHLFRMADENLYYTAGNKRIIVEYLGWKICPLICYDLRFPVFSRNNFTNSTFEYDLLIYVANWPEVRKNAWKTLLEARAHENLAFVIGVNRIGVDGSEKKYSGNSNIINFKGESCIPEKQENLEFIDTVEISYDQLLQYRNKFNSLLDADKYYLI